MATDEDGEIIRCTEISKRYGTFLALNKVSIGIGSGEELCIVDPSGSDKSTFLRRLNGIERINEGKIVIEGIDLANGRQALDKVRLEVGMVFQSFNLFSHLSVRRNITLAPIKTRRLKAALANERAETLLRRVGMLDQIDKYPAQL